MAGAARSSGLGLLLALAVFGRGNADNLLELMHKMYVIAVAALIGNTRDAVIRAGKQALGKLNAAVDHILREADAEAAGIKLLEITAAQNQIAAHRINAPVLLRIAVNALPQIDKFTVIGRSLLILLGRSALLNARRHHCGDLFQCRIRADVIAEIAETHRELIGL